MTVETERCYRLVLADDHEMLRCQIKGIIEEEGDLEVVGEAGDGVELLKLLDIIPRAPHMAIIDISMPNLGGIEVTHKIRSLYPDMKVLILSIHKERAYIHGAFFAGADGYVFKQDVSSDLLSAIESIRNGGVYLSHNSVQTEKH